MDIRKSPAGQTRRAAEKVSLVGITVDLLLTGVKLAAGIFAHSAAMISDAVHSASDLFSSFIVIAGVRIAHKESDREHPYGHERFECVAAIVLAVILAATGVSIALAALRRIAGGNAAVQEMPGVLALAAALLSIAAKESMFWYTKTAAERLGSPALKASAWHHRSDAFSSVGALIGIAGARMGFPVADSAASLVISVFIGKAALDIFRDAVNRMVDRAADAGTEDAIRRRALGIEGVLGVDLLQTRTFGSRLYVEMEISADGALPLSQAHEIAERVHDAVEEAFPGVKHIMVHVNPVDTGRASSREAQD